MLCILPGSAFPLKLAYIFPFYARITSSRVHSLHPCRCVSKSAIVTCTALNGRQKKMIVNQKRSQVHVQPAPCLQTGSPRRHIRPPQPWPTTRSALPVHSSSSSTIHAPKFKCTVLKIVMEFLFFLFFLQLVTEPRDARRPRSTTLSKVGFKKTKAKC